MSDRRRILIEHGGTVVTFEGQGATTLLPALLPLLDGTRTVDELEEAMGRQVAPALGKALTLLEENHLLVDGAPGRESTDSVTAAASFAAAVTRRTTPTEARGRLAGSDVAVLGSGAEAELIGRQLGEMGIRRVRALPFDAEIGEAFVVAAPDRHEVACLERLNRRHVEDERAWLQVLPHDGRHLVIGPVFLPGASACRECYRLRRAACSGFEDDFELIESKPTRAPVPPPLATIAASITSLLVVRWLTVFDPILPGRFYALETGAVLRLSHHHVLRVPRCTVCTSAIGAVPLPWFKEGA